MITRLAGEMDLMRLTASRPLRPGNSTSRRTTSGTAPRVSSSRASSELAKLCAHSRSCACLSTRTMVRRKLWLSSTSQTTMGLVRVDLALIGLGLSVVGLSANRPREADGLPLRAESFATVAQLVISWHVTRLRDWRGHNHQRARPRDAADFHGPTQIRGPATQVLQAVPFADLLLIKADAVILDAEQQQPFRTLELNLHARGLSMPGDVVNDFFKHGKYVPPQLQRGFWRFLLTISDELERRAAQHRPGCFFHSQHELAHGVRRWIQEPDDVAQGINRVSGDSADFDEFLGKAGGLFGNHLTEEGDSAEIAANFIVQVARHTQAQAGEPSFEREPHFISGDKQQQQASSRNNPKPPSLPEMRQNNQGHRCAGFVPDAIIVATDHSESVIARPKITVMSSPFGAGRDPLI